MGKELIESNRSRFRSFVLSILGCGLGIIFLFPIYILALNSFKTQRALFADILGLPSGETFTLSNYSEAIEKLKYLQSFFNSFYITVVSVLLILLVSSMAAWVLVRHKTRTSNFIFIAMAMSIMLPFQCVMLPISKFAGMFNLLNPIGLIFMYVGFGASISIVMMHGFIKNIPEELEEAAVIDGCNVFQLFFIIVIPLLRVILITVAVLNIMWIWNDFLLPSLIINKDGMKTLPIQTFDFFGQFATRWDLASAALIMGMLPIIIFYIWSQKYIINGITEGSIK